MLKKKAIKKILITSTTIVILLMIYIMPGNDTGINKLKVKPEISYQATKVSYIYLLNDNDLLVRVNILIDDTEKIESLVKEIINKSLSNNINPKGLQNIIPKKTKLIDIELDNKHLSLNFSKDILKVDDNLQEKLIESIAFSIFEIKDIEKISIYVEDENINKYFKGIPQVITRNFGINKTYNITSLKDVQKVVVYYMSEIDNNKYMVPVTNYVSNKEDKIKIIIESLSSSYIYQPNLISLLNSKTELINYEITDDIMMLNFNNSFFGPTGNVIEEVVYTISNSVFDTYDVNKLVINVENKTVKEVLRNESK